MRKLSTFGLHANRLADLLTMASPRAGEGEQPEQAVALRELLDARLSAPLSLETGVVDSVPAVLGRPCRDLVPLADRPLRDVLSHAGTSLAALRLLKDYGRALALRWEEGPEHAVGMTIYYVAVAAALTYHGQKIASGSLRGLGRAMDLLIAAPWITPPMAKLLSDARRLCRGA